MRKWVVLALGAVLAAGGLVSIWQGSDIIQIERGWTEVIAGTVALAGGVVTLALYAVIAELELMASANLARKPPAEAESPSAPAPLEAGEPQHLPEADLPQTAAAEAAPSPEPEIPPTPPAAPEPASGMAAARGFRFRRPSRQEETPSAEAELPASPAVPAPPRRVAWPLRPAAPVPPPVVSPEQPDSLAPHVEALDVAPPVSLTPEPAVTEAAAEPEPATHETPAAEPALPEPVAQAPLEPEPAAPERPRNAESSHDWLERALAGEEETATDPAFAWLRAPAPPPAEPAPQAEPMPVASAAPEPEPEPEAAPEPGEAPEPAVVGRYSSGGADYTLYADGSIEAQTGQGNFRFASMADLRAHIEAHSGGADPI